MTVTGQHGARVLVGAVVLLLITAVSLGIYFFGNTKVPADISITRALQTDERAGGVVASNVMFVKQTDRFARGTLTDDRDGEVKTFYALLVGDIWRIVEVTTKPVSCERYARLGFPDDFIADCVLSFADAVTVAEIDATIGSDLLQGATLQVIGFVEEVTQTEMGSEVLLSSGGASQTVTVTGSVPGIGSLVVVTVEDLAAINQPAQVTAGSTAAPRPPVTSIAVVGGDDTELVTDVTTPAPLPQETNPTTGQTQSTGGPVTGVGSQTIYKINAPTVAPPPSYFFSEFDIDRSFENVRIDGSF